MDALLSVNWIALLVLMIALLSFKALNWIAYRVNWSADQTSMVPNYADLTELEKEYTSTGGSGGSDEEVSVPMC